MRAPPGAEHEKPPAGGPADGPRLRSDVAHAHAAARPSGWSRRARRHARAVTGWIGSSAAPARSCAFFSGLFTFALLLMLLVGGLLPVRQPDRRSRSPRASQGGDHPQERRRARDRHPARARRYRQRPPDVRGRLSVDQVRGMAGGRQVGPAQGRRVRDEADRQHSSGDRRALRGQDDLLQGDGAGGPDQLPDRREAESRPQPLR